MATIRDVAKLAQTSITTVSRVLNNSGYVSQTTREKVNKAIEELNYKPNELARGLVTDITRSIGLIVPDITSPYFAEIAKSIEKVAGKYNYNIFLCNTNWDIEREKRYLSELHQKRVDGIIYAIFRKNKEIAELIDKIKVPVVVLEKSDGHMSGIKSVNIDNYNAGKLATEFLIKKGNRKIAFVGGESQINVSKEREEGYEWALKENGIEYSKDRVVYSPFNLKGGYDAMKELSKRDIEIDSIFLATDLMAIGAANFLTQNSIKVPEDISIVGFDNIELSSIMEPTITTVNLPIKDIAETAMKKIINMIYKKDEKIVNDKIDLEIVERRSTLVDGASKGINLYKYLNRD